MPVFNHKIDSIQVLRAVAVVLVVYYHSIDTSVKLFGPSVQSSFFFLKEWGAIGVDLFFVISGFIMTRIMYSYQKTGGWKTFALKRVLRIIPLYWGLSLGAILLIIRSFSIKPLVFWKTISFFPIFETKAIFPIIPAGWSLSYEIYFYLLIVLVLRLGFRRPQIVTLFVLISLSAAGIFVDSTAMLPRFLSSPLLVEFALGVGCGMIYDQFQPDNSWHRVGMVIAFLGGLLFLIRPIFWNYGGLSAAENSMDSNLVACWRSLSYGVPSALFIIGFILLERVYTFSFPALLIRIGDASYSNYLLHMLIIGRKAFLKFNFNADSYSIILVILCTGLSLVLYQYIEKPLTDRLNHYFFKSKKLPI